MDSEPRMLLKTIRATGASVTSPADLANGFANDGQGRPRMDTELIARPQPTVSSLIRQLWPTLDSPDLATDQKVGSMRAEVGVSSPEPAVGVSVTPGTRQDRLWPEGNRIGRVAWFMYTRRQP